MQHHPATLLLAPFLASCGAIMAPGPFPVLIDSNPPGAIVIYQGEEVGVTPCTVAMQRSSSEFVLRRDEYRPQHIDVGRTENGWVAGNIVTLGLGMLVDIALGTDESLITEPIVVNLGRANDPPRPTWVRVPPATEPPTEPQEALRGLGHLVGLALQAMYDHNGSR